MPTLREFRDSRLQKLQKLYKLGVDPYPARAMRSAANGEVRAQFAQHEGKPVTVVGRLTALRGHGQIMFADLKDASGSLQLLLRADKLGKPDFSKSQLGFEQLELLDLGDFVEASGRVTKTQKGEVSVEVARLRLLTKALRPMPSSWSGLKDKETRLRRRYLDTNVNEDVHQRFLRRSAFWQAHRDFLNARGFAEINVPVLEHTTGGADAKPFKTHMDVLGQDLYLRISHELPLKRLIGGNYEKVYDIGPRFRNEHYTDEHLPEHVAMEFYWAYADWREGMKLVQELIITVAQAVYGKTEFNIRGHKVNLGAKWQEIDFASLMKTKYGLDVHTAKLEQVKKLLAKHKIEVEKQDNLSRGIDKLWKHLRKDISGPAYLVGVPKYLSPLAKSKAEDPAITERFQPILAGTELGNGWSELNDPQDQLQRFLEQQQLRAAGDEEAQMLDIDYVEMLEYGMPPTFGYGHSERLFWMLEDVPAREGVPFPQLRPEVDEVTKTLYPEVFEGKAAKRGASRGQDFSKRVVTVVNKALKPWQVANAVAHMDAIIGNELPKDQLTSGDFFVGSDGVAIPRNSQYPIIIMQTEEKQLHKLYAQVVELGLVHHVFIKEMQDTTNDAEIEKILDKQSIAGSTFYGVSFFATNAQADKLTKGLQLYKG